MKSLTTKLAIEPRQQDTIMVNGSGGTPYESYCLDQILQVAIAALDKGLPFGEGSRIELVSGIWVVDYLQYRAGQNGLETAIFVSFLGISRGV